MNIEVTEKQYTGIKSVAERMGISPTEFVLRSVKACTLLLDLLLKTKVSLEKQEKE